MNWDSLAGLVPLLPARAGPREKGEVVNDIRTMIIYSGDPCASLILVSAPWEADIMMDVEQKKRTGLVKKVE